MIRLAADKGWLHKATKEIAKFWRYKRERSQSSFHSDRTSTDPKLERTDLGKR
jgi:hypothetical protein